MGTISAFFENIDNLAAYNDMPLEDYYTFLCNAGIEDNIDLITIKSSLVEANSVLIVGAGYGREIQQLLDWDYTGHITAIERSDPQNKFLQSKYGSHAEIIHGNCLTTEFNGKYDAILLLFFTSAEFNNDEAAFLFQKLANHLTHNGSIYVDSMTYLQRPERFCKITPAFLESKYKHHTVSYRPCGIEVLQQDIRETQLYICKTFDYITKTHIQRQIYKLAFD